MNPYVHQIALSDHDPPRIDGYVAEATASVRDAFPGARYRLWGRADGERFVADHFGPDVAWAFRCLLPYAYKADLLKLCLLHTYGGWYVDAGVRMLRSPLPLFDGATPRFVLFRSTGSWDMPWNCSLALLYAEAGHPVFTTAIDSIVANCRSRNLGVNPLSPTMSTFGRALAHHGDEHELAIGTVVDVDGEEYVRGFAIPPFGVIAARKPDRIAVGDLVAAGLEGGNNYDVMWKAGTVYGDEAPPALAGPVGRDVSRLRRARQRITRRP